MAGLQDVDEKQRARWAKAERYSHGVADNGMGDALRLYYTLYFPIGALLLIGVIIGVSAVLPGPIDWGSTFTFGAFAFAFIAGIGGFVYDAKRLKRRANLGDGLGVLFPLEPEEQKRISREITGRAPATLEHVVVARAAAVLTRKQEATHLLVAPFWLYIAGSLNHSVGAYMIPIVLLMIAVPVWRAMSFRRKGRFLARTDGMEPAESK